MQDLDTEYLAYNGFNRPALFFGIPLVPFVVGLFLMLLTFFVGVLTLGFYGLILPILIIGALFMLKQFCARDPNSGHIMKLKLQGLAVKGFNTKNVLKVE